MLTPHKPGDKHSWLCQRHLKRLREHGTDYEIWLRRWHLKFDKSDFKWMKLVHAGFGREKWSEAHSIQRSEMQSGALTGQENQDKGELFWKWDINTKFTRRLREDTSLPLFLQEKREGSVPLFPSGPLLPNFFSNNPHFVSCTTLSHWQHSKGSSP